MINLEAKMPEMSKTPVNRSFFGSPFLKRKCIVCIMISNGVNDLNIVDSIENSLVNKLDELRDRKALEEGAVHQTSVSNKNGDIHLKVFVEKLTYFKLEQLNIPRPPVPITDHNAFFVSLSLPNEDDYEENSRQSWSWNG